MTKQCSRSNLGSRFEFQDSTRGLSVWRFPPLLLMILPSPLPMASAILRAQTHRAASSFAVCVPTMSMRSSHFLCEVCLREGSCTSSASAHSLDQCQSPKSRFLCTLPQGWCITIRLFRAVDPSSHRIPTTHRLLSSVPLFPLPLATLRAIALLPSSPARSRCR